MQREAKKRILLVRAKVVVAKAVVGTCRDDDKRTGQLQE